MNNINVGLDIDGVVIPWHYSVWKYYTEFKGYEGSQLEFWTEHWLNLPDEETDYVVSLPHLYSDVVPSRCVIHSLNLLATLGTLYYVTSRPAEIESSTRKFFDFLELPFRENIYFSKDKPTTARFLGLDYFLDDLPANVLQLQGITKARLLSVPHNSNIVDRDSKFKVVYSIREFYEEIFNDRTNTTKP